MQRIFAAACSGYLSGCFINRPRPALRQHLLRRSSVLLQAKQAWLLIYWNERAVQALIIERAETGSESTGPVSFLALAGASSWLGADVLLGILLFLVDYVGLLTLHQLLQTGRQPRYCRRKHRRVMLVFFERFDALNMVQTMPVKFQLTGMDRAAVHLLLDGHSDTDTEVVEQGEHSGVVLVSLVAPGEIGVDAHL